MHHLDSPPGVPSYLTELYMVHSPQGHTNRPLIDLRETKTKKSAVVDCITNVFNRTLADPTRSLSVRYSITSLDRKNVSPQFAG